MSVKPEIIDLSRVPNADDSGDRQKTEETGRHYLVRAEE
tara:strand:- start:493 stop:609 length:117 start_codon:yes stop_codon:yes gene_type:complete